MKLLLIVPPAPGNRRIIRNIDCSHEAKAQYLWHPNDLLIISSLCAPQDSLTLLDATEQKLCGGEFLARLRALPRQDAAVFALSGTCWESDLSFFHQTKKLLGSCPVFVFGDLLIEREYRQFLLPLCAGVIGNPYLLDLKAMARAQNGAAQPLPGIYSGPDDIVYHGKTPLRPETAVPRHELFLGKGYRFPFATRHRYATVTTMWGCPFSCSYCTDSQIQPVVRRWQDVEPELALLEKLGVRELFMADKSFGAFADQAVPLLELMAEKHDFGWTCYFHPQVYTPQLLELMKKAGCHTIITGVDSADIASLAGYGRRVSKTRLEEMLRKADTLGISVCADFILGLPHETESAVIKTIDYALSLPLDFASFNIAAPLPGSGIRKEARRKNLMAFGSEDFDTLGTVNIMGNEHISGERLKKIRRDAILAFYTRPSYLLRRLRRTRSPAHFYNQFLQMLALFSKGTNPKLPF